MNNLLAVTFKIAKCTLILLAVLHTAGWVLGEEPVDATDPDAPSGIKSCTLGVGTQPLSGAYSKNTGVADECHRWGLVWRGILGASNPAINNHIFRELSDANTWAGVLNLAELNDDETSGATRLPTIKELVRIFDYTIIPVDVAAGVGLAVPAGDDHFRSYLQAAEDNTAVLSGYLISSTYRNIASDGGNVGDNIPKILGIELQTGKVVVFDQDLNLCVGLNNTGACDTTEDVNVYAFKVKTLP
jgi:hypothetical protein